MSPCSPGYPQIFPGPFHGSLSAGVRLNVVDHAGQWETGNMHALGSPKRGHTALPISFSTGKDEYVCWSRMQAEAGQDLETIVARKEHERRAGDGLFMWGVGNAPATITTALARMQIPVRAVFSIMKSRPKLVDASPSRTAVWRRYIDVDGVVRDLPAHCLVTSRADSAGGPKKVHYALMCHSPEPLELRHGAEQFDPASFRNASGTGAPIGNSQVTALLRRSGDGSGGAEYEVNLSAWLVGGYWVRLTDPTEVTVDKQNLIDSLRKTDRANLCSVIEEIRRGPRLHDISAEEGSLL
jgi:hypothetical protein